jgi:hypothetical protein
MMEHTRHLIGRWLDGGVILSPRDLNPIQLVALSKSVNSLGGEVFLDPQFYLPLSDHERLRSHSFWPTDYESNLFWSGTEADTLVSRLFKLNQQLRTRQFILPGLLATEVDEDWLNRQSMFCEAGQRATDGQRIFWRLSH